MFDQLTHKRILVVVAHPDDELLGLGATIHRLVHQGGCQVRAVILGEGITSRGEVRDPVAWEAELEIHRSNIDAACRYIGYASVGIHAFPDNRFDTVDLLDLIKVVEAEKAAFRPEVIFTHHGGDTNIDHRRTFEAVLTSIRPVEGEGVHTLLTFETPSSTEWQAFNYPNPWQPNVFIEVHADNLQAKINGMECYEFERRPYPHPRSPEGLEILAKRYGVQVGKPLAEAFMLIRSIG